MAVLGLEYFEDVDTDEAVALVPKTANPVSGGFTQLNPTDIVEAFEAEFTFAGALGAYSGTENVSPYFPYIFVQAMQFPYQSGNLKIGASDGHIWWLWTVLRGNNVQQTALLPLLGDQAAVLATGYTPQTNQSSAANYTVAASTNETYNFTLEVPVALYFRNFWDDDGKGNIGVVPDVFVNPLMMSSSGRSITPKIQTNPVQASTLDDGPFVHTSTNTTPPAWTDAGSQVTIRRRGWREPGQGRPAPPLFNWAHIFDTLQFPFQTAKPQIPLPDNGQLLAIIFRFFDPTLNGGIGGPIPISNIISGTLSYGPGLVKYNDAPKDMQRRIMKQHGVFVTSGVWIWDLYANSKSNQLGEILNTYITAGIVAKFDFTGNVPGAGSYATVSCEWLTQVG